MKNNNQAVIIKSWLIFVIYQLLAMCFVSSAFAGTFVAYGPETFTRSTGSPVTVTKSFSVLNPNTTYTLEIINGGLSDTETEKVSSSIITLNGVEVVGPQEFNQNVDTISKPITLISANELSVEVRGAPGGAIAINIIGVDNDPPVIASSVNPAPNGAGWHNTDPTVSFECTDAISGIASCTGPITVTAEGEAQTVTGTAVDNANNSAMSDVIINLDKTAPVITPTSHTNGELVTTADITLAGNFVEDLSKLSFFTCNGSSAVIAGTTFSCDITLVEGSNIINLVAGDNAGNETTLPFEIVLDIADNTPPQISVVSPADGSVVNSTTPAMNITFSDDKSGVDLTTFRLVVNGVDVTASSSVTPTGATYAPSNPLPAGNNEVSATILDNAGNSSTATSRFTVSVFRAIAECAPTSGVTPLRVRFRSKGEFTGGSIVQYRWDFDGNGTYDSFDAVARDYDRTFSTIKTYTARLQVTNNLGATAIDTCTFEVKGYPPVASASASPTNGAVPLDVTFTGSGTSANSTITQYEWDLDGDGVFEITEAASNGAVSTVTYTYTAEGTFSALFRVTDNNGETATASAVTTAVRVGPEGSPSVTATATPTSGNGPLNVSFNGSATDDGSIVQWDWDFDGDGTFDYTSATSPATSFTYQTAGAYAAALRATDNDGLSNIDLVEIKVAANATLSISNETFDPYLGATSTVNTTLSTGSHVKLLIKDEVGFIVRTLVDEVRAAGSYTDQWDGTDDDGNTLPEGPYYAVLEYQSGSETKTVDHTFTTGGSRYNPPRSRIPSTFSPFAGDPLDITFTLSRASEVTAFMGRFYSNTRLITFMERVPMGRGTHTLIWNGENADGQLMHPPPGDRFLFGIWGYTLPNNAMYLQSGAHVADVSAAPSIYNPGEHTDDQGTPRFSVVSFTLSKAANVELTVADAESGATVARRFASTMPAGPGTIQWDGKDDQGNFVAPGRYRLGVSAFDTNGYRSMRVFTLQRIYY